MQEIYDWCKNNGLWFTVGMKYTHKEFVADIWTHLYKLKRMRAISWHGVGQTPEEAMNNAYDKAKEGLPNIPKTEEELNRKIYYGSK